MTSDFEAGIIGGGPAGSAAAAYLSENGFNVCLFEKKSFPRETLCGEFLSLEAVYLLKEMGLFEDFLSLRPNRIEYFRFFNDSGKSIKAELRFEAYGMSRSSFDNLLLCNARKKGVTIFQPALVTHIVRNDGLFTLKIKDEKQQENLIRVNYLIAAYGKQNPLDKILQRNFVNYKSGLNGVKFHITPDNLTEAPGNEIHIYSADDIYCGVNKVENNKITFCFLENRKYNQPPPRMQLNFLREKNESFKKLFVETDGNLFGDIHVYGTGNIFFGSRDRVEKGVYMIGDSGGVIAPLAGDGIGIAMESGKLIAGILDKMKKTKISVKESQDLFNSSSEIMFSNRIRKAGLLQDIILKKMGRNAGFILLKLFPSLLTYLIKTTRSAH